MAKGREALEFVNGMFALGLHIADQVKDGFQVSDLPALLLKASSDPVVLEGLKGVSEMPGEVAANPIAFTMDLLEASLSFARKVMVIHLAKAA